MESERGDEGSCEDGGQPPCHGAAPPRPRVTREALGSRRGAASRQAGTPRQVTLLEKGMLGRRVRRGMAQGLSPLPGACRPCEPFKESPSVYLEVPATGETIGVCPPGSMQGGEASGARSSRTHTGPRAGVSGPKPTARTV